LASVAVKVSRSSASASEKVFAAKVKLKALSSVACCAAIVLPTVGASLPTQKVRW
jgi:hypothetical protein